MNILIKNILTLITEKEGFKTETADICISGDSITAVGKMPEGFVPDKIINGKGRFAIPGLINSHTHAYMSLYRNIADDLSFDDWLFKTIFPLEDRLTAPEAYIGAALSYAEMIKSGTTCCVDMHIIPNASPKAAEDIGIRAVITRGVAGESDSDSVAMNKIALSLSEADNFKNSKLLTFMLAPHALYTCGESYLKRIVEIAKERGMGLHTHLSETQSELAYAREHYNMTPTEFYEKVGIFECNTIAAHCVHLTDNDIDILKEKKVNVATNPISNLKLANGIAPLYKMYKKGVNILIGTDSSASNNDQNLFSDMRTAALLQKGITGDPCAISASDVLRFATVNAAKAIGVDTGAIAVGKKADITIIDTEKLQFYPKNNMISALCYSANGSEVDTVIVNGRVLMEKRQLLTVDEEKLRYDAEKVLRSYGIER